MSHARKTFTASLVAAAALAASNGALVATSAAPLEERHPARRAPLIRVASFPHLPLDLPTVVAEGSVRRLGGPRTVVLQRGLGGVWVDLQKRGVRPDRRDFKFVETHRLEGTVKYRVLVRERGPFGKKLAKSAVLTPHVHDFALPPSGYQRVPDLTGTTRPHHSHGHGDGHAEAVAPLPGRQLASATTAVRRVPANPLEWPSVACGGVAGGLVLNTPAAPSVPTQTEFLYLINWHSDWVRSYLYLSQDMENWRWDGTQWVSLGFFGQWFPDVNPPYPGPLDVVQVFAYVKKGDGPRDFYWLNNCMLRGGAFFVPGGTIIIYPA